MRRRDQMFILEAWDSFRSQIKTVVHTSTAVYQIFSFTIYLSVGDIAIWLWPGVCWLVEFGALGTRPLWLWGGLYSIRSNTFEGV